MQLSAASLAAFSVLFATAYASPATPPTIQPRRIKHIHYVCNRDTSADACSSAKAFLLRKENNGCDVFGCIVATASAAASCLAAADMLGLDPLADLACIASSRASEKACDGCHG